MTLETLAVTVKNSLWVGREKCSGICGNFGLRMSLRINCEDPSARKNNGKEKTAQQLQ